MENIKASYENFLKENLSLLELSKAKEIYAFLGNTGSGKSTLINYLSGKDLIVQDAISYGEYSFGGKIVLKNPNDISAMKIGETSRAETVYPKFIQYKDFLLFDLPGFGDNRGIETTLINTTCIKHIIDNAKSIKIVFCVNYAELESKRGDSFRVLKEIALKSFPKSAIDNSSILVVTNSKEQEIEDLKSKLLNFFTTGDLLNPWINNRRLLKFSMPMNNAINANDSHEILNCLCNLNSGKYELNIDGTYNTSEFQIIKKLISEDIDNIFQKFLSNLKNLSFSSLNLSQLKTVLASFQSLESKFLNLINNDTNTLSFLLKSIANSIYEESIRDLKIKKVEQENIVLINSLIQTKENEIKYPQELAELERKSRELAERLRSLEDQTIVKTVWNSNTELNTRSFYQIKGKFGHVLDIVWANKNYKGILDVVGNGSDACYENTLFSFIPAGNNYYQIKGKFGHVLDIVWANKNYKGFLDVVGNGSDACYENTLFYFIKA